MIDCRNLLRCVLLLPLLLLAACEIEGGVASPATPGAPPPPTAAPPATASDTAATPATPSQSGSAFQIGLLERPTDLLPYHDNASDERMSAPLTQLLFPAPLLPLSYTYTNTGILERIPTVENGGVELRPVEVYLDDTGVITTTPTDVLTQAHQLIITYHWNPALRWSDDVSVTADDSVFAYEVAQQLSLGEQANERLRLTEHYERVDDHTTRAYLQPDMLELPGSGAPLTSTVDLTSTIDLSNTHYLLSFWTPLPRHILQDIAPGDLRASVFARQPVSYGPYRIRWNTESGIGLERNPYYTAPEPLPAADVVSFVFYETLADLREALDTGSIDVAVTEYLDTGEIVTLDSLRARDEFQIHYVPAPIWEHLSFNLDFAFLRDLRIRRAIAHGTNRQAMVDELMGGHVPVLQSWMLPEHWAAALPEQLTSYEYNPHVARALFDEVGFVDVDGNGLREQGFDYDSDGTIEAGAPITLTLLTTQNTPLRSAIAERFQADMAHIGLAVDIREQPARELYSPTGMLFRRQFELAQFAWIASTTPHGFELWGCAAIPRATNNWSGSNLPGWCRREANQAIVSANTALDGATRSAAYLEHQRLFSEEIPVLPLFQRLTAVLHSPGMRGLRPDPTAPVTWNIAEWTRE
jgi:peptide/nickel transport system substrate-binding protein